MHSVEIRKRFLDFFEKRGHAIIPSSSLVPENDPSVLFITAGMQPLSPYLLGQKHPKGNRLVNVQKCVRTQDIDEVGDKTHDTFFEMLGNWSLGDYFKEDAIAWSFELLTSTEYGFGLDPRRIYITVFEGNDDAPRDEASAKIWKSLGVPEERIYYMGAEDNWWSPGDHGPCGPDTEMFYNITPDGLSLTSKEDFIAADERQEVIEVWNDVFMEYEKKDGVVIGKLSQQNVDTGAGLERLAMVLQNTDSIFETDLFKPIVQKIEQLVTKESERAVRIVADHVRTAVFMIADGVTPANTDRGYVLRRLLRRAVRHADALGMREHSLGAVADEVVHNYAGIYEEVKLQHSKIVAEIEEEERKFRETLEKGLAQFEKHTDGKHITGREAFDLYQTYGFPVEVTEELARERGVTVDRKGFDEAMEKHQKQSRTASAGKFKGGLADHSAETVRLHTAHHLLLAALQKVLGKAVKQRGSNITSERLRIDFTFDRKLTDEEKDSVEKQVNTWITDDLPVVRKEMFKKEAEKLGAEMEFGQKYPDIVSVYFIGGERNPISIEFCGGPHVERTGEIGAFTIKKEEASSAGIRRIKAVLK